MVSESFRNRADSAAFYEAYTAAVLTRAGLYVTCHPWVIDGKDHGESWDLDVYYGKQNYYDGECVKVEVKSISPIFTGPDNYPFKDMLVCSLSSWQRKWPGKDVTQRDFLFVSQKTGSIVWLPTGSPVGITEIVDASRPGYVQKTMKTPKANLRQLQDFVEYVKA